MKQEYDKDKIEKMREAGEICSGIFAVVKAEAKKGVKLIELDQLAEELCSKKNVKPAFKGFDGFPGTLCTGVNDVVVHGIPDEYALQESDLLSIDFGIEYKGVYSDLSVTMGIGDISETAKKLMNATKEATLAGISAAVPGNKTGDIGNAMESVVLDNGFSVVKEMVGHGIGYQLHETPYVPGYGQKGHGDELYKGQTLAIEAIVNQGGPDIFISSDDGWTSYTEDGKLSALFEHTIVVDTKPEILTAW